MKESVKDDSDFSLVQYSEQWQQFRDMKHWKKAWAGVFGEGLNRKSESGYL